MANSSDEIRFIEALTRHQPALEALTRRGIAAFSPYLRKKEIQSQIYNPVTIPNRYDNLCISSDK